VSKLSPHILDEHHPPKLTLNNLSEHFYDLVLRYIEVLETRLARGNRMASRSYYIIIVGCGRLGSVLANRLSVAGHQLVVVDQRATQFDQLTTEFSGFKIVGDASEISVLRQANIQRADCLFATTTQDNINLMVAQIAKKMFNVQKVVARVYDPAREVIYSNFGVETISPTKLSTEAFMNMIV
jgi:trk system potassium uptake protein TrkA